MSAESIAQIERFEPSTLEKNLGERLQVPIHAFDDSGLCVRGLWKATKKHTLAIFYKNKDSILVAGDAPKLSRTARCWILPLEGGGAVPWNCVTPAQPCDLGINPDIVVSEIGRTRARPSRRYSAFHSAMALSFVNHKFVGRVADPDLVHQSIQHLVSWEKGRLVEALLDVCFCYWTVGQMHDAVLDQVRRETLRSCTPEYDVRWHDPIAKSVP